MGEKDITEKILADYNDVFADIVNVLLFGGKTVVDENMLESIKDKSQYKTDGEIHQEERDVSKVLKGKNVHIAFIGFEHQTDVDSKEALRVIAYDGAAYKRQLLVNGGKWQCWRGRCCGRCIQPCKVQIGSRFGKGDMRHIPCDGSWTCDRNGIYRICGIICRHTWWSDVHLQPYWIWRCKG